jgi:hypothetical protein
MAIGPISSQPIYDRFARPFSPNNQNADKKSTKGNVSGQKGETPGFPEKSVKESKKAGKSELPVEKQREVEKLQSRDKEVRTHEAAHQAAGGTIAGSPTYSYQTGPDGRRYAVGGAVQIDTGTEKTPQATIAKMHKVKAAALAPADPSGPDRSIASRADANIRAAQAEIAKQSGTVVKKAGGPPAGLKSVSVYV